MDTSSLTNFQKVLIKAYYYLIIVDGKVDAKELTFANKLIKREEISRENFDATLDSFDYESSDNIRKSLIEDLEGLSKPEILKIVAYMSLLAESDGFTDPNEKDILFDLYEKFGLNFKDVLKERENLVFK